MLHCSPELYSFLLVGNRLVLNANDASNVLFRRVFWVSFEEQDARDYPMFSDNAGCPKMNTPPRQFCRFVKPVLCRLGL